MNHTISSLVHWQPPRRDSRTTLAQTSAPTSPPATSSLPTQSLRSRSGIASSFSFTPTGQSGSTVWGPGALTGKLLKRIGVNVEKGAEYMVIRTKLSTFERMQPELLGSSGSLTSDRLRAMDDQCPKLVDLCIMGMDYPPGLMTRAFKLILSGFQLPGRHTWSYHIAEAISNRDIMDIFELFQEGFFALLDDTVFRIDGVVDLETLRFRCPVVAYEIASIISHLAQKDCATCTVPVPAISLSSSSLSSQTAVGDGAADIRPTFSSAIIRAGFFRLVQYWVKHGLPHWDQRGVEHLEDALQDIADAQEFHHDLANASEARELMRKLQGRRLLLLNDVEEEEPEAGDLGRE